MFTHEQCGKSDPPVPYQFFLNHRNFAPITIGPRLAEEPATHEFQKVTLLKKKNREKLAREILAYFLRNPQCVDDLKGIANWRLLDQMIHRAVYDTSEAVEWLVSKGYLAASDPTGADRIYRLNEHKRDEAVHFVKDAETED